MPYRGRPSAGCQTCRQRKIKCDRQDPTCVNCKKAGWKCPGYPDVSKLIFHDETAKVESKVKAAQQKAREFASSLDTLEAEFSRAKLNVDSSCEESSSKDLQLQRVNYPPSLTTVENLLPPNVDDLAIGNFFHSYVHNFQSSERIWYIEDGNGCLVSSIKAVGIASMTRAPNGPSASPEARRQYLDAIQLTNTAIRSAELATKDSTLLAINVLGIFESITGFHRTMDPWRDHINGASALLAMRGAKQFETDTGGRLFLQTSMALSIACIQNRTPIPEHVHEMKLEAEKQAPDPNDHVWRFYLIRLQFTDLYAKLKPQNLVYSPEDAYAIIEEAISIDNDIIALSYNLPRDSQYEHVEASGPTVFAGYCHIFPSFFPAQVWNGMMSTRIHLLDIIVKASQALQLLPSVKPPPGLKEKLDNVAATLACLQNYMFGTVPQHLGTGANQFSYSSFTNIELPDDKKIFGDSIWRHFTAKDSSPWRNARKQSPDLPFVRMSGGYLVQWSLHCAGQAGKPGSNSRKFAIDMLKFIGQRMGLQQAQLLARNLEEDIGWKMAVYSSL